MGLRDAWNDYRSLKQQTAGMRRPGLGEALHSANVALSAVGDMSRLAATGMPSTAVVLQAVDTGGSLNDQALAQLTLAVTPPAGGPEYQAVITSPVPRLRPDAVAPGATVPVRIDPGDPQALILDLAALAATPGRDVPWPGS